MKAFAKVLLVAAVAAPFAAQAELKSIDDAVMADVSGQAGLLIEAGFGTTGSDAANNAVSDFSGAGITIDAFKWEVDLESYDSASNTVDASSPALNPATGGQVYGGFIAEGIAIAGAVDVTIDGVVGVRDGAAHGGLAMTFANSDIDFRVNNMALYVKGDAVKESMGAIEILGMNIDGLDLIISGVGVGQ